MDKSFSAGSGSWTDPESWSPTGAPAAGDTLTVSAGTVLVADQSIDAETLLLGSDDASDPAVLALDDATLGAGFVQKDDGASSYAELSVSGTVTLAGTLTEAARDGGMLIDLATTATAVLSGSLSVSNGDTVTIEGGTVVDDGTITVDGGTLVIDSTLQGKTTIVLKNGGTLEIKGASPAGLTVAFADGSGTLVLDSPQYFASTVTGFQNGDSIVLAKTLATVAELSRGNVALLSGKASDGTEGAEIASFRLSGQTALASDNLFLSQDAQGNSILSFSVERSWTGGDGDWYDTSNWTAQDGSNGYPGTGDTAVIASGTASIAASGMNVLDRETIKLSGASGGLTIESGQLGRFLSIMATRTAAEGASHPTLTLDGQTVLDGTIAASGASVTLVLDIAPGTDGATGTLTVNSDGSIVASHSAGGGTTIDLHEGLLVDNGLIQVDGTFDVGAAATLDGTGTVVVKNGELLVKGTVGSTVHVDLSGGANAAHPDTEHGKLVIEATASFEGVIDNFSENNQIDLLGVEATAASFDQTSNVLSLTDANGDTVAALTLSGSYSSGDFTLSSDGDSGTRITETSSTQALDNVTYTTLPIPILVSDGGTMTLGQILTAAFGSTVSSTYGQAIIEASSTADMGWAAYWNLGAPSVASWSVAGAAVAADTFRTVAASDWSSVVLTAGNAIESTAEVLLPTLSSDGIVTGYTGYLIQTVDPGLFATPTEPPTAASIVAAAETLDAVYANTANAEDCYNIAAQVAAAAGATFGTSMASTDPTENAASGFWRIAYAAPQDGTAIADWSSLVQAGDILRIGWSQGDDTDDDDSSNDSPHSFTVLSGVQDGQISVFDNALQPDDLSSQDEAQIGIHDVDYWTETDPEAITIFRLDPNGLFLITGDSLQNVGTGDGELLQGNSWNDLFIPGEQDDTVLFGSGTDILADIGDDLDGATLGNLQDGDSIDVTDMDAATATVGYDAVNGLLTLVSGEQTVTITVARGLTGQFTLAADGGSAGLDGGTLGSIYDLLYDGGGEGTRVLFTATAPQMPVPAVPTGDGATIDADALVLSGSGDPGATVQISLDGETIGTTAVSESGTWSFALPDALPDGDSTLQVVERNGQGVSSSASTVWATRDASSVTLRAVDGSGAVITSLYDDRGAIAGWTVQTGQAADGTSTLQRYDAGGALTDTVISNNKGWILEDRTAAGTTMVGHDADGTVTATATTAGAATPATMADSTVGAIVVTAAGSHTAVSLSGGGNTVVAQRGDQISVGSGSDTVTAATGGVSVSGGDGVLRFIDAGGSTVAGGSGSETIFGGAGGHYAGGSDGDNLIHAAGGSTVLGGGAGDVLTGADGDLLLAASGNSTLVGGGSTVLVDNDGTTAFTGGNAVVFGAAGGGSDVVIGTGSFTEVGRGGQTTVFGGASASIDWAGASHLVDVAGAGAGTLVAGTGNSVLWINDVAGSQTVMAVNGAGGGAVEVVGFRAGTDKVATAGYGSAAVQTVQNGALTLTLSDHTSITFLGVTSLT